MQILTRRRVPALLAVAAAAIAAIAPATPAIAAPTPADATASALLQPVLEQRQAPQPRGLLVDTGEGSAQVRREEVEQRALALAEVSVGPLERHADDLTGGRADLRGDLPHAQPHQPVAVVVDLQPPPARALHEVIRLPAGRELTA